MPAPLSSFVGPGMPRGAYENLSLRGMYPGSVVKHESLSLIFQRVGKI